VSELVTTPLDPEDRIVALDILRGLALGAMVLVHFHMRMRVEVNGIEDLVGWGVWILVEQKAWGTFAILFGAGFAILLRRLEARRRPVYAVFLRRLAALALFGLCADVFFGFAILWEYACLGVPLLLVRNWPTRALLVLAALAACAAPVAAELSAWIAWWSKVPPHSPVRAALEAAVSAAEQQASYAPLVAARWARFVGLLPHTWRDFLPSSNFTLFLLGLLAVRHRVFDEPARHVRLIVSFMTFGFVSWAVAWLLLGRIPDVAAPGATWPLRFGLGLVQDQWLCFTYVGAVLLLLTFRPAWIARLMPVGRAGRMALTNYMMQAVVIDVLASGYGFGLKLRPFAYAAGAVILFTIQCAVSTAWLARFLYGPFEWIWRGLTYARIPPLRRALRPASAAAIVGPP